MEVKKVSGLIHSVLTNLYGRNMHNLTQEAKLLDEHVAVNNNSGNKAIVQNTKVEGTTAVLREVMTPGSGAHCRIHQMSN